MKRIMLMGLMLLGTCVAAHAQCLRVGVRGGVNTVDYSVAPVTVGDATFSAGNAKVGYEAGLLLRFRLANHLHLQSGLNYQFNPYAFRVGGNAHGRITIDARRLEIPVELGLNFGVLRLFAGPVFRVAQWQKSSVPRLLRVKFNDSDIALTGGAGLHIRRFFIDFRVTGYPWSSLSNTFYSGDASARVKVRRNLLYGGSVGFYF